MTYRLLIIICLLFPVIGHAAPEASRTSGLAPLAVFFDAGVAASTESSAPFHDLDYTWDFGDPDSGTWGPSGKSKNTDKGPLAAHVYETAGTYTASLTVRDSNGMVGSPTEFTITVTDFSAANTTCISTGTDFTGCPAGATTRPNITTTLETELAAATDANEGGTENQILVKTTDSYAWIDFEDHPQFASLLTAFNAAGLNSFNFIISSLGTDTLVGATYYQNSIPFPVAVAVTDTSTSYDIAGVEWKLNEGSYASMVWNGTNSMWEATGLTGSDGAHTLQFRATDDKSTPNTGESSVINIVIDTTDPVVDLTP